MSWKVWLLKSLISKKNFFLRIGADIVELDIVVILQKDLGVLELFAQFII